MPEKSNSGEWERIGVCAQPPCWTISDAMTASGGKPRTSSLDWARRWDCPDVPFIVVYDANVLYPSSLRDLLIRVGQVGLVRAKWTDEVLDETFRNLKRNRPDLDEGRLDRTRQLMNLSIRDVLVTGYEPLIPILELPDPDDRHVLAAAIKAGAQVIVTHNIRDFPATKLESWSVLAEDPDEFVLGLIDLDRQAVYAQVQRMADAWKNPPGSVDDVLTSLERDGLVGSVAALRG